MNTRTAFSSRSSFTLVEMLTAIAVLSILMAMIFSMLGSMLKISDSTSREADSSIEAKQVLDRIGADIAGMLIRPDVDQFYYQAAGNDKMFFYTQQAGFFSQTTDQSPLSLVGYRINTTDNAAGLPVLERLSEGLTWNNGAATSMIFLTFPTQTSVTQTMAANASSTIPGQWSATVGSTGDGTSTYYDSIGSQIFRFEICFQLQNGSFSQYPGYTNSAPTYTYTSTFTNTIANTTAIVVAIATLDSKSRKLVPNATAWATLMNGTTLPDASSTALATNGLMDTIWNNALQQPGFATTAGIPAVAASHIKVYQRYYYLNTPKVH